MLHFVDEDVDIAILNDHGHDADVVHGELAHTDGVHRAHEREFAVDDFAGVNVFHAVVLSDGFQVEHPSVKGRDTGVAVDVVLGAACHEAEAGEPSIAKT